MSNNNLSSYTRNKLRDTVQGLAEYKARLKLFYEQWKKFRTEDAQACDAELADLQKSSRDLIEKLAILSNPKISDRAFTDAATQTHKTDDVEVVFSCLLLVNENLFSYAEPETVEKITQELKEHALQAFKNATEEKKSSKKLPRTADKFDGFVIKLAIYNKDFPSWVRGDLKRAAYSVYCIVGPDGDYLGMCKNPELAFAKHLQRAKEDDRDKKQKKSYLQREISQWGAEEFEFSILSGFDDLEDAKKMLKSLKASYKSTTEGYNRADPLVVEARKLKMPFDESKMPKPITVAALRAASLGIKPSYDRNGNLKWVRRVGNKFMSRTVYHTKRIYLGLYFNNLDAHFTALDRRFSEHRNSPEVRAWFGDKLK